MSMPLQGRHARPSPRYLAAGVFAVLGVVAAAGAVLAGSSAGLTVRFAAVGALVLIAVAALLVVRGLARADEGLFDEVEESARHAAAVRRELTALAGQVGDGTGAQEVAGLRADLARLGTALEHLQHAGQRTADEFGERVRDLTDAVRADRQAVQARVRALEAQLEGSTAQARALDAREQLRLTVMETTVSGVSTQVAQLRGQAMGLAATLDTAAAAGAAGRAALTRHLAALEARVDALVSELDATARQVAALRAEQEGRSYTGQTSAVRMTLPLVRAALRQTETPAPGDPAGGVMAGDVGQVTYAAPRADGPDDGAGDPGPGGAGEVS
jgi:predicted  nucleic acid-binding Zn-ribbon protein